MYGGGDTEQVVFKMLSVLEPLLDYRFKILSVIAENRGHTGISVISTAVSMSKHQVSIPLFSWSCWISRLPPSHHKYADRVDSLSTNFHLFARIFYSIFANPAPPPSSRSNPWLLYQKKKTISRSCQAEVERKPQSKHRPEWDLAAPMSVTIDCRKNKENPVPTPAGHAISGLLSYTDQ